VRSAAPTVTTPAWGDPFDIDRMKPINDGFGHDAGDVLLAGELMRTFRGEDVACRYGGDEFTIVLPEASLADVWRRAEQFREAVRAGGAVRGQVPGSGHVDRRGAYPDHGLNSERVLLAADAPLRLQVRGRGSHHGRADGRTRRRGGNTETRGNLAGSTELIFSSRPVEN
jgi:diguanylate cyclase (GGDEF)-like protein